MKYVVTGLESAGKSLYLADIAVGLFARNEKWEKKYGFTRKVLSNLRFSEHVHQHYDRFIEYWPSTDLRKIVGRTGVDIIWDEISTHFNAQKKEPLPVEVNAWLRQGAKQGVELYATAQEFHDIHNDFRRRVWQCDKISKVMGSDRGGENRPPSKRIWGLCWKRELDIRPYNELEPKYNDKIGRPFLITKKRCGIFDTHQKIERSEDIPYRHVVRKCEDKNCKFVRVLHI